MEHPTLINLIPEYTEIEIKRLISEALNNNIKIYIIDNSGSNFELNNVALRNINRDHPQPVQIYFREPSPPSAPFRDFGDSSYIGFSELRAEKTISDRVLGKIPDNTKNLTTNVFQKYSTPLIELMSTAIEQFWLAHDTNKPPKSKVVISWLKEQGKKINLSGREATAIDLIIRPRKYKSGGNKSQKNSKGDTQKPSS